MNQCWERFCSNEHGKLSVPPPAVIELIRQKNIKVLSSLDSIEGELSTPTGIALLSNLVDYLEPPSKYSINSYGVGIGNLKFPFPNLVRVYKITSFEDSSINEQINPKCEEISVQEAWIDDQTPEDISNFVEKLRIEGLTTFLSSYQYEKNRIGFSIQAILPIEKKEFLGDYGLIIPILLGFVKGPNQGGYYLDEEENVQRLLEI